MFEIEMKFRMSEDRQQFALRLSEMAAIQGETEEHQDHYFDHPCRKFVETGEALRVRRINGIPYITYKGPKKLLSVMGDEAAVKIREELEWCLASGDGDGTKTERLLECLGFVSVAKVLKKRIPNEIEFQGRKMLVVVDSVEGLGDFVEVECLAGDDEDGAQVALVVGALAEVLACGSHEPRSYLRMVLEANGK